MFVITARHDVRIDYRLAGGSDHSKVVSVDAHDGLSITDVVAIAITRYADEYGSAAFRSATYLGRFDLTPQSALAV